jgi:hypothetical protein
MDWTHSRHEGDKEQKCEQETSGETSWKVVTGRTEEVMNLRVLLLQLVN